MISQYSQRLGTWDLRFTRQTPQYIRDIAQEPFSHVLIHPTPLPKGTALATLQQFAMFSGVVRDAVSHDSIGGPGVEMWLGDEDGKGDRVENGLTSTNDTFDGWVTFLLGSPPVTVGNVQTGLGSVTRTYTQTSVRTALDDLCAHFSATWRVNPDFTVDAGTPTYLHGATPTVIAVEGEGGRDQAIRGLAGVSISVERDWNDYGTAVIVKSTTSTHTKVSVAGPYFGPAGAALNIERPIDASATTAAAQASALATAQQARFAAVRDVFRFSCDEYALPRVVKVGGRIWGYARGAGIYNLSNEVTYRGQTLHPRSLRVVGMTWPVRQGMGVVHVQSECCPDRDRSDGLDRVGVWAGRTRGRQYPPSHSQRWGCCIGRGDAMRCIPIVRPHVWGPWVKIGQGIGRYVRFCTRPHCRKVRL